MDKETKILFGVLICLIAVVVCWILGVQHAFHTEFEQYAEDAFIYSASNWAIK